MNFFEEKVFDKFGDEIKLYYCGKRFRSISHSYGPYTQDRFLIYFIKEGRATLTLENGESLVLSNGFFVNFPKSNASYECAEGDVWTIKWIMTEGKAIERYLSQLGITRKNPYVTLNDEEKIEVIFDEMFEKFDKADLSSKIYCISLIHKLFSALADDMSDSLDKGDYIYTATKLIENNFHSPDFNVTVLANKLGLNHNYFSILYKRSTGTTPMKAINEYRLQNACKMLNFTDKLIKEVAFESGFSDELYFSRVFKSSFGVSPSVYKKNKNMGF